MNGIYDFIPHNQTEALSKAESMGSPVDAAQVAKETPFVAPSADKSVAPTYRDVFNSRDSSFGQTGLAQ